jgi:phosphoglucomutase
MKHGQQTISSLAGKTATPDMLVDLARLEREYYSRIPDRVDAKQHVVFGTSGHRGSSLRGTFTERHILAITQAICEYRKTQGIDGPLFMGKDTHALSRPAERSALEVLAAQGVPTILQQEDGVTPTPVISRAILAYNRQKNRGLSDGIIITPSHNPPEDGGIKYNPPHGGPAEKEVTNWIELRANEILRGCSESVKRIPYERALRSSTTSQQDFLTDYVNDLGNVIDTNVIREAGLKLGADPLGGASTRYWEAIGHTHHLDITVVNPKADPTFSFMPLDHDGKIRMDCSSRYAMSGIIRLKENYRLLFGNDPDCDRFGVVTPAHGLISPNHFLSVAAHYLLSRRVNWMKSSAVGKTVVSSNMIDRVAKHFGRKVVEVPVGFKWFVTGLLEGSLCFGGEESAGASFLRQNGITWTTDKDGIIMNLLAAEITARTGKDPGEYYEDLTAMFGTSYYTRVDAPLSQDEKQKLLRLSPQSIKASSLAGEVIEATISHAPGNQAPLGGLKVITQNGWFVARPSGTEDIYKIYAESFESQEHLDAIVTDAQRIVRNSFL